MKKKMITTHQDMERQSRKPITATEYDAMTFAEKREHYSEQILPNGEFYSPTFLTYNKIRFLMVALTNAIYDWKMEGKELPFISLAELEGWNTGLGMKLHSEPFVEDETENWLGDAEWEANNYKRLPHGKMPCLFIKNEDGTHPTYEELEQQNNHPVIQELVDEATALMDTASK